MHLIRRTALLFFALLLWAAPAAASPGTDLLSAAEDFLLLDMDKARDYADKAISRLQAETAQGQAPVTALARAHYVKAFLLTSGDSTEQEILGELSRAHAVAPGYKPPQEYVTHPTIKKLLPEARKAAPPSTACPGLERAEQLFADNDFCGAFKAVCPLLRTCGATSDVARLIARVSKNNCPEYRDLTSCPDSGAISGGEQGFSGSSRGRIGVMPLLFRDIRDKVSNEVRTGDLLDVLRAKLDGVTLVPLSRKTLDAWSRKHKLEENFREYVVREFQYRTAVDGDSLLDGLDDEDIALGGVPIKYARALEDLFRDQGLEYVLFTMYDADRLRHIELRVCLYHVDDPGTPVLIDFWKNITLPRYAKKRLEEIPESMRKAMR